MVPKNHPGYNLMATIKSKLRYVLTDKRVSLLIVGLAILARVLHILYFFSIHNDLELQVLATHSLVNGHGVTIEKVLPSDLSTITYDPLIKWPPGYSYILAPFYRLFEHDILLSGLALRILAAINLILMGRYILRTLDIPIHLINIYTILTGFFIYFFYNVDTSDTIAVSLFTIPLGLLLSLLKTNRHIILKTTGIVISLFFCAALKYMFMPVVFIIPLFLILKGFADSNAVMKKAGAISFFALLLSIGALLVWQKYTSGSATYILATGRGFFPENLRDAFPFIPGSFMRPGTLPLLFPGNPQFSHLTFQFYKLLHVPLFAILLIFMVRRIQQRGFRQLPLKDSFYYLVFFLSVGLLLLLIMLSLVVEKETWEGGIFWTYVSEERYYGLINILLHLVVIVVFNSYKNSPKKFPRLIAYLLVLLMLPEMFRGVIFTTNRILALNSEQYNWQHTKIAANYSAEFIRKQKELYPGKKIVVAGPPFFMDKNAAVLYDINAINNLHQLNTREPVLLIVILREKDLPRFRSFLSENGKEPVGRIYDAYFFNHVVMPH